MNSKAIRKQRFAAVAMVLVAAVALGSSTYAWFAANRVVTATTMAVPANSSSSLVISDTIASGEAVVGVGTETSVTSSANTSVLVPATHSQDSGMANYLKYNTNATAVSAQTGYAEGTTALTFASAVNGTEANSNQYYVDYVVYVAAAGSKLENQDLTAKITTTPPTTGDTLSATSIDFYVEKVDATSYKTAVVPSSTNFKGTLNVAGKDAAVNDGTTTKTELKLVEKNIIPQNGVNTVDGYLRITMRVYIDGNLMKSKAEGDSSKDQAYVYSNKIDLSSLKLAVEYTAGDAVTTP